MNACGCIGKQNIYTHIYVYKYIYTGAYGDGEVVLEEVHLGHVVEGHDGPVREEAHRRQQPEPGLWVAGLFGVGRERKKRGGGRSVDGKTNTPTAGPRSSVYLPQTQTHSSTHIEAQQVPEAVLADGLHRRRVQLRKPREPRLERLVLVLLQLLMLVVLRLLRPVDHRGGHAPRQRVVGLMMRAGDAVVRGLRGLEVRAGVGPRGGRVYVGVGGWNGWVSCMCDVCLYIYIFIGLSLSLSVPHPPTQKIPQPNNNNSRWWCTEPSASAAVRGL